VISEEEIMSKKILLVVSLTIIAVLVLAACERSAAPSIVATQTVAGNVSEGTPQPTGMSLMQAWGTSTAVYVETAVAMGLITAAPTSEMPDVSVTPTPEGTLSSTEIAPTSDGTDLGVPTVTPMVGTTPVVVVATATPGRPASYTLEKGEYPWCIARRFNVDPNTLLAQNGLSDGQTLQPGLTLSIPQSGSFPGDRALHPHPTTYTVNVDDSFNSIACYFGDLDPSVIAAANGLSLTSPLTSGQILNIP
jgi:LysM repeat protein